MRLNRFIIIPIGVLLYIGYMNTLPFGGSQSFSIDVGGADTEGLASLAAPLERFSQPLSIDGTTCRRMQHGLVYFEAQAPRIQANSRVVVKVRLGGNLADGSEILLGARDKKEWSYAWQELDWGAADNQWRVLQAEWALADIHLINEKLIFCLKAPSPVGKERGSTILWLDRIDIEIQIPPLWRRL